MISLDWIVLMPTGFPQSAVKYTKPGSVRPITRFLMRFIWASSLALCLFTWTPCALADSDDDNGRVSELMRAENYEAAEKAASESLARGPSGFLSGMSTLSIHLWRAHARLLLGDAAGAIEDAEVIIEENHSILRPDAGYSLRAITRALTGDAKGALADFDAASMAAQKGLGSNDRTILVIAARGIAKIQLNDLDGADADLTQAIAADYGWMLALLKATNAMKELLGTIKSAVPMLKEGNMHGAEEAMNKALLSISANMELNDLFLPHKLLLTRVAGRAQVSRTSRPSASNSAINPAIDPIRESQQHFDRAIAAIDIATSPADYENAIQEFGLAVSFSPLWADAYYNLGLVQETAGSYHDAIASFRYYETLDPNAIGADSLRVFSRLKSADTRRRFQK